MARLTAGKTIPAFRAGDTVIVSVNVVEGSRKRVQAFEGVVIARRNRGLNSSFTVRKISSGEGVERTFQLYSPMIAGIEVKRHGDVRRAKLYYLRERSRQGRPHQGTSDPQRKPNPRRWETCLETPESLRRLRGFILVHPLKRYGFLDTYSLRFSP